MSVQDGRLPEAAKKGDILYIMYIPVFYPHSMQQDKRLSASSDCIRHPFSCWTALGFSMNPYSFLHE